MNRLSFFLLGNFLFFIFTLPIHTGTATTKSLQCQVFRRTCILEALCIFNGIALPAYTDSEFAIEFCSGPFPG